MQKNKRRFCVPRKQKKIEDGFQASSFLSSAAVHFYDPINRALNDWQVFFGTEFQLVTGSLALLTFREQHFGIEIPFYRKPAGLDIIDKETFDKAEEIRMSRAKALGRVWELEEKKDILFPTNFTMPAVKKGSDDPFEQAAYAYSLIESKVDGDGTE